MTIDKITWLPMYGTCISVIKTCQACVNAWHLTVKHLTVWQLVHGEWVIHSLTAEPTSSISPWFPHLVDCQHLVPLLLPSCLHSDNKPTVCYRLLLPHLSKLPIYDGNLCLVVQCLRSRMCQRIPCLTTCLTGRAAVDYARVPRTELFMN